MRWKLKEKPDSLLTEELSRSLGIDPVLCTILVQRGVDNFDKAKHFFRPSLKDLHDPFLMKDMDKAVERIQLAIRQKENILIYGDYDVDGTTAVSLVFDFMQGRYPNVATYIPDRYNEGYGVSFEGIDFAHDNDIGLIIALDCGIKANDKVDYARAKGIDFIICDHHRPGDELPGAVAVLDPKRQDCPYPYKELCGCGIGFKLVQALLQENGEDTSESYSFLDLVATAVAADIVPLTGENRILAHYGLKLINQNPRPGIRAIIENLDKKSLNITDVVFNIAPRINAAGRLKHGSYAVELLTETNFDRALSLASSIDDFNTERRELDQLTTDEALEQIIRNKEEKAFTSVVYNESWHKGVIGIVASRLIEKYYRPTLVFTKSGDKMAASARSVKGFDVYNALEQCSELIEQFGGHKYAAGLTLDPKNYDLFKAKFEQTVRNTIPSELLERQIQIDARIFLENITPKFVRILKQLGPFGPQNMKPVFMASGLRDNGYGRKIGELKDHLKLNIITGTDRRTYQAVGFGLGSKYDLISAGKPFMAAFTIEENHWNGHTSLQLNLKDIKAEE